MARIALCQDVMVEYMGFMLISAVLKEAGHVVEVFCDDGFDEERFLSGIKRFRPDIAGFSVLTPTRSWALRIAKRLKEDTNVITVLGNLETMFHPEMIEEDGVDVVCLWEGELPMKEMAACLDSGRPYRKIKGLWVKTTDGIVKNDVPEELVDLDSLPFHDRAMYDKYAFFRNSKYLRTLNGRGCPYGCSFCSNQVLRKHFGGARYVRKRSPELAIREIEHHVNQRKVKFIFFADEVFWINENWLREFLALYKERVGIPFNANLPLARVSRESIELMADAGAAVVSLSAESGDEEQRRDLFTKNVTNEELLRIAGWLREFGITYGCSSFFGVPGDTVEDHVQRLEFYRKLRPAYLWTTFFAPYPELPLTTHPSVQALMPEDRDFSPTLHHEMYLDVPEKQRLARLKKVYFLCMLLPRISPLLVWLTKFRIPLVFDLLFLSHFTWYALRFEQVSLRQFLLHLKTFTLGHLYSKHLPEPEETTT